MRSGHGSDARPLTWAHGEAAALARAVLRDLRGQRRARADDRHLAAEDVHEVRQLVERRAPQDLPDARDAGVAGIDGHPGADVLGAVDHRAELQDVELAAVEADAALAVDRMPARLQADRDHRRDQQRRGDRQRDGSDDDVEGPARHRVPWTGSQPAGVPWRSQSHRPAATEAVVRT